MNPVHDNHPARARHPMAVLDLEGVLIPEIWLMVAHHTGDERFLLTTKNVVDYDELMRTRIIALAENGMRLSHIQKLIHNDIMPFEGAVDFLRHLRSRMEVIILSDTFIEFFTQLREVLEYPVIFCNSFYVENDMIKHHTMRLPQGKAAAVQSFQSLNFTVAAAGDSFNDIGMLQTADHGVFFKPSHKAVEKYPGIPICETYDQLTTSFNNFFDAWR